MSADKVLQCTATAKLAGAQTSAAKLQLQRLKSFKSFRCRLRKHRAHSELSDATHELAGCRAQQDASKQRMEQQSTELASFLDGNIVQLRSVVSSICGQGCQSSHNVKRLCSEVHRLAIVATKVVEQALRECNIESDAPSDKCELSTNWWTKLAEYKALLATMEMTDMSQEAMLETSHLSELLLKLAELESTLGQPVTGREELLIQSSQLEVVAKQQILHSTVIKRKPGHMLEATDTDAGGRVNEFESAIDGNLLALQGTHAHIDTLRNHSSATVSGDQARHNVHTVFLAERMSATLESTPHISTLRAQMLGVLVISTCALVGQGFVNPGIPWSVLS